MSKLLRLYGDTMMSIGIWFMKRSEKYATWITLDEYLHELDVK